MIIIQQKGLKCGAALGKGRRNRKVRGAGRRNGFAIEGGTFVSPEYPSLSARDIAEGAESVAQLRSENLRDQIMPSPRCLTMLLV